MTGADEVVLEASALRTGLVNDKTSVAVEAANRALEVMRVNAAALAAASRSEKPLHRIPRCYGDKCFVRSRVLNAVHSDDALVVRVGQYPIKARDCGIAAGRAGVGRVRRPRLSSSATS